MKERNVAKSMTVRLGVTIIFGLVGCLLCHWLGVSEKFINWMGWGLVAYSIGYLAVVVAYDLYTSKIRAKKEGGKK